MNKLFALQRTLLLLPLLALPGVRVNAQSPPSPAPPDDLFRTIASLDRALFDSYNGCDLEKFKTFFTDDVEFYHDQGGLTVGARAVAEQVEKNIGGKARRELVAGTLQVYPMHGYGAVEIGVHRFYQPKEGSEPTGEAKFIHLWQRKDGVWKITRVISYDHVSLVK
jgi:ketosteroid isomerase-like protein